MEQLLHGEADRCRQFDNAEVSTLVKYAAHFGKSLVEVGKVAYAKGCCHSVESLVGIRQCRAVLTLEADNTIEARLLNLLTTNVHHAFGNVGTNQPLGSEHLGCHDGKVARTCGNVEYRLRQEGG